MKLKNVFNSKDKQYKLDDIDFGEVNKINRRSNTGRYTYQKNKWVKNDNDKNNSAVIMCAGDLMCEPAMSEAYCYNGEYDFRSCFKYIKPVLQKSDFAIANLETMVTDKVPTAHEKHRVEHHTGIRYHCNAPISYLDALGYAGFDGFALANNHNVDGGYEGIIDTLENIDKYGFARTGLFKNEDENRVLILEINNIKIGIISYTEHINRGLHREILTENGISSILNIFSEEKLNRDVKKARSQGVEFLICYIHFLGKEYSHNVWDRQRKTAQIIADNGVDCIMGSHTHSIQEYDRIISQDGRTVPVVYSLGNFITSDNTSMITRTNIIYKLELEKINGEVIIKSDSYVPCRVIENTLKSGYVVFPTQERYHNKTPKVLEQAQDEIEKYIGYKINLDIDNRYEEFEYNGSACYDIYRQLTVGKICNIIGDVNVNNIPGRIREKKIDYITARYTWVKNECAYFSRYLGEVEEREARLAFKRGAYILFCSKPFYDENGEPLPCIVVNNPAEKFYKLNRWIKGLYDVQTIAITGSVGKTTTKEMLYYVINSEYKTLKNSGNANTYAAISDTIQKLNNTQEIYLQEVCAFSPGWVKAGGYMLNHDMCLITNIGYPHIDLYKSIDNILEDKISLIHQLPENGVAFLNYDDNRLASLKIDKRVISFGINNKSADYVAENIVYGDGEISFDIKSNEGIDFVKIHMYGEHNILNALASFAIGRYLNISKENIIESLNNYRSEGMRQNVCNVGGYRLYIDCYNCAPNSMINAIHALSMIPVNDDGKHVVVFGDITRLGFAAEKVHEDVAKTLIEKKYNIDKYLFFGEKSKIVYEILKSHGFNVEYAETRMQLNELLKRNVKKNDVVLFKAGHQIKLAKSIDQVWGTSLHLTDPDVLLDNMHDVSISEYSAKWIDGAVEIRKNHLKDRIIEIPRKIKGTDVKRIGKEAFQHSEIEKIFISGNITNIGFAAFYKNKKLNSVIMEEGVKILERSAFNGCVELEEIDLPEGLIEIGERAFYNCTKLKRIYIPASVGKIDEEAFYNCSELTIECNANSYAEQYALNCNIKYEIKEN